MKCLSPAIQSVMALLGKPRDSGEKLRLSQYCVRADCPDGELLYNTLTGELLLLAPGESAENCREELTRRFFLVPESCDEYTRALQLRKILTLMQPKKSEVDHFLIYTTTDCNARCYYCYELGRPRFHMTEQTARDVADYILRVSGDRPVSLAWFGGEPLYNRPAIETITQSLRAAGKDYRSRMVSNGYLFDEETVSAAVRDWNMKKIQITLDGTEEVYNRAKAYIYRDGASPYRRVLRNIGLLLDAGVSVNIRLNLGVGNFEELKSLSQELAERFPDAKKLCVYVALLRDFGTSPQDAVSEEERLRRWAELNDVIKSLGLRNTGGVSKKLRLNACMADSNEHLGIAPDGALLKCEHEIELEAVGSIYGGGPDRALAESWKECVHVDFCRRCELFPQCVRLKKCVWTNADCLPFDRSLMREKLIAQIRYTYERRNSGGDDAAAFDGGIC